MIRRASVLPLLMLALASCADVPEPESTSVPAAGQAVPAYLPDLRAQPVDCEVPSVCTTTNGMCRSLGKSARAGLGLDPAQACAWLAHHMQLGQGSGFEVITATDGKELSAADGVDEPFGSGMRWRATVGPSFEGISIPQLEGLISSHDDGLRWHVPAISWSSTGSGVGVVHGAEHAERQWSGKFMGTGSWSPGTKLVYARPSDASIRAQLRWPDEAQGLVYRPTWCFLPLPILFVDAATGLFWEEDR